MRDISVKVPKAVDAESDLEEGEIPEFEVSSCGIDEQKDFILSKKGESSNCLKSQDNSNFNKGRQRNDSPPSEGEFISDEEKWISGDEMLQKDAYENNLVGRRPKYMHPFQSTYGCVEDIMTKIGESLGRNSNYYKSRRLKESRHIFNVNNGREIDSPLQESSPVIERLRYNNCKKSRYREIKGDFTSNIKDRFGKMKYRNSFNDRKIGQEIMKKRKREDDEFIETGVVKTKTTKKYKVLDQKGNVGTEYKELREKQSAISKRIFKEIPLPQERETQEVIADDVINVDDSEKICHNDNGNLQRKMLEKNTSESCNVGKWDDCLASRNSPDLSEQMDEDDKDDDLELIQLRLLALTSNKNKSKAVNNDCLYDNLNVFNLYDDHKNSDNSKIKDDEEDRKNQDNSSVNNSETENKCRYNSDIDRYELFLRAEALKTALLKKHQHILKKRKNSRLNAVSRENSDKNLDSYGIDVTETVKINSDISQEEVSSLANEENCLEVQSDVIEIENPVNKHAGSASISENGVKAILEGNSKVSPISNLEISSSNSNACERDSPIRETPGNLGKVVENPNINLNNTGISYQSGKKKIKRLKLKKNRKLRNSSLSESNKKQNNLSTKEEDCQNINDLNNKEIDNPEKKFNLLNSLEASHFQLNNSLSAHGAHCLLESELYNKGSASEKPNVLGLGSGQAVRAPATEVERIIIHLGSESSEEESPPHYNQSNIAEAKAEIESNQVKPLNSVPIDVQKRLNDYEKSVELLLKGARRMIEKKSEISSRVPPTPEAVYNHLAPSQRLEYMRLKQKIAEREKLKKTNKNASISSTSEANLNSRNNINSVAMNNVNPSKTQNNVKNNITLLSNKKVEGLKKEEMPGLSLEPLKKDIRNMSEKKFVRNDAHVVTLGNAGTFPSISKAIVNVQNPGNESGSEKMAVNKLNNVKKQNTNVDLRNFIRKGPSLDRNIIERKKMLTQNRLHLERLKVLWKNIKLEKMIEGKYEKEIKRLKLQQNFFELKINQQRLKIKKLAEESKQIYEAFQKNNKKVEIVGKRKKSQPSKDESIEKLSVNKEMPKKFEEVATFKADDVSKVGGDSVDQTKNVCTDVEKEMGNEKTENVTVTESKQMQFKVYSSPLEILNNGYESADCPRVDPNVIMCQYDLLGKCNDAECVYQHWRT